MKLLDFRLRPVVAALSFLLSLAMYSCDDHRVPPAGPCPDHAYSGGSKPPTTARCGFGCCQGILAIALNTNKYVNTQSNDNFFVVLAVAPG